METKTWYQPLDNKDKETGLFYKVWEVPEGLPVDSSLLEVGPGKELLFPKFNNVTGFWEEDTQSLILSFKDRIANLEAQLEIKG